MDENGRLASWPVMRVHSGPLFFLSINIAAKLKTEPVVGVQFPVCLGRGIKCKVDRGAFKAMPRSLSVFFSVSAPTTTPEMEWEILKAARAIDNRNKRKQILVLHSPCAHKRKLFIAAYWEINMPFCLCICSAGFASISDAAGRATTRADGKD
jgi:hypothetical protein